MKTAPRLLHSVGLDRDRSGSEKVSVLPHLEQTWRSASFPGLLARLPVSRLLHVVGVWTRHVSRFHCLVCLSLEGQMKQGMFFRICDSNTGHVLLVIRKTSWHYHYHHNHQDEKTERRNTKLNLVAHPIQNELFLLVETPVDEEEQLETDSSVKVREREKNVTKEDDNIQSLVNLPL